MTDVLLLCLDGKGRVLHLGRSAEKASGYAAGEMFHVDPFERLFAEDGGRVRTAFLSATDEQPIELEADLCTRDGRRRVVHWSCCREVAPVLLEEPVRYLAVGIDRTDEREREQQALQNARLATAAVLAAGLAHEIRNPLNGASLHLSVLDRELGRLSGVSSSANEALVVVRSELRRLASLLTDFLQVARPRALVRVQIDLNDVVRRVLAQLQDDADRQGAALVADLPSAPVAAFVDDEWLKQALVNLVQNALDAVEKEGRIVVRVRAPPGHLELEVEDNGPGVPEERPPIFDAFYTTKRSGTGLGLSIVHRIVADHGGDVTYASNAGRTVFRVRLPAKLPPDVSRA